MPTRRPDHTRLQSSVCMGGVRVYTIINGVFDVLFHVTNHTLQQSQSLFYVCGSMPFPFSISIACLVKASQEDRHSFFKSTTSQQPPMTVMQHWNKGPPTGTYLHVPRELTCSIMCMAQGSFLADLLKDIHRPPGGASMGFF